ncbi:MAG TPA: hypothetical protein VMZ31_11065 [Phycisphaerae bacterium]|nr:hypothetical protein [Phycisphaerae bacterium]
MLPNLKHNWLTAGLALLLWTGCNPDYVRMYEQRGEHYKAHQLCREALTLDPQNQAAAAGLLRNAPAALTYWREQALAAATTNDWRRAAVCHQQVLMIKPDEKPSIDALRQLAHQHPDQIALPIGPDAVATTALVKPPEKVALPAPPSAKPPASESSEARSPQPQSPASSAVAAASAPRVPSKPTVATPPPAAPAPAPAVKTVAKRADKAPRQMPVKPPIKVALTPPESKPSEARLPRPQSPVSSAIASASTPQVPSKRTVAAGPPTAPAPSAKTVVKRADKPQRPARVARRVNPYRQKPTVRRGQSVSEADVALVVCVSRDDPRYAERALLTDGIFVRVKDTDFFPLDADMELYVGNKRVAKLSNLRTGSVVTVLGRSGEPYELLLMHIDSGPETVKIGLRRVRHADSNIGPLAAGVPR